MAGTTELSRIDVIHSTDARPRWQRRGGGGHQGNGHAGRGPYRAPATEVTEVLGIPHRELTPAVQRAIGELMAELEHERRDADLAQERVAFLEDLADRHTYLPAVNRRALFREMGKAAERAGRTGIQSVFVLVHVRNAELVRRRFGRRAADAMLIFAADQLNDMVRATDTVGVVANDDFGIILALAETEGAAEKAAGMVAALNSERATWQGTPVPFEAAAAVHVIVPGDTPESILAAADADLLRQEETLLAAETRAPWDKTRK